MNSCTLTHFPHTWFRKRITPLEDAHLPVTSKALQYGLGFFGGVRGYVGESSSAIHLFRLKDHVARFLQSARILGVSVGYTAEELHDIFIQLTLKNAPTVDTYYRPYAFADSTDISPHYLGNAEFAFALYMLPLGDYISTTEGNAVCVSSWHRVRDNAIPARGKLSGAYINSALAKQEAVANGFTDAILLTGDGHVAEGTAMNLCMVRAGTLITPPVQDDVLEGITRDTVLTLARDCGIPTVERSIDRTELYVADELFFCGTGAQVAWISHVDRRRIGAGVMGPVTKHIREMFFEVVRGKQKKYAHWLTTVQI